MKVLYCLEMILLKIQENAYSEMLKARLKSIYVLQLCMFEEKILEENIPVVSVDNWLVKL